MRKVLSVFVAVGMVMALLAGGFTTVPKARAATPAISTLPVGSRIKFGTYKVEGSSTDPIIWKVIGQNHTGYPANSTTLLADKIIDLRGFDAAEAGNTDVGRANYGSNRYKTSNLRQWLNSGGAANAWWTAQNPGDGVLNTNNHDATPADAGMSVLTGYDDIAGFLSNFTTAERAKMLDTTLTIARNTATDTGATSETVSDRIFLLSETEVGLGNENGIVEGTTFSLASRIVSATDQCIANTLSTSKPASVAAWYWWLRTPSAPNSANANRVNTDGAYSGDFANRGSYGVRPALNLANDILVSLDGDGYYTVVPTSTITFDSQGGTPTPAPITGIASGDTVVTLPAAPTEAGYTFNGWFTATTGGTAFTASTPVTASITVYAQWTINQYTVTFDKNGGDTEASPTTRTADYNTTVTLPTTVPTKTGYAFASWNTQADGLGTAFTAATPVTASLTVYAKWTADTYTVTYDLNGGTAGTQTDGSSYLTGATVTVLGQGSMYHTGYNFTVWNTVAGGTGTAYALNSSLTMGTADVTLFAQWTGVFYSVTFDGNGGGTPSPVSKAVQYTSTYGALATVTKTGYAFNGWYTATSGGTQVTSATTMNITTNQTLYAQWTANTYTVTFNKNGGDTEASPTTSTGILYNGTATLPTTDPTWAGHTFASWNTQGDGYGTAFTATTPVTATITVYAQRTANTYTVTFDGQGGTPSPASTSVTYGSTYGTVATVTKTGYTFAGWYTATSGGTQVTSATTVSITAPQTLYAQWTADTYTVAFDKNGGSGTTDSITGIAYNAIVTVPTPPTKALNTFAGWFSDNTTFLVPFDGTTHVTANITVYAKWTAVPPNEDQSAPTRLAGVAPTSALIDGKITGTTTAMEYQLATGGTYAACSDTNTTVAAAGNYVVRLAAKTGYNAGATTAVTVPAYTAPITITYTVTFDSQGGSAVAPITGIASGATVTLPAAPTKAGYTLNGWFIAITGGTAFTASTAVTADVTVYAQWTVTYVPAPAPTPAPAPVPIPVKKQMVLIFQIGKPMFWDNSIPTKLDSTPIIKNSRTLLPIRAIIEALGGTVAWDPIAHKVTVTLGTRTVVLWIGKSLATVNGVSTPIDATNASVVPIIINSRTILPLRFVSENLGCTVLWVDATQMITITYTP